MTNQVYSCATIVVVFVAGGLVLPPFAAGDLLGQVCGYNNYTYTAGDAYADNLNMLLNWLPDSTASTSCPYFGNWTSGTGSDAVHAVALCRGDADSTDCLVCLSAASQDVRTLCPSNREATVYRDVCHLSYSDDYASMEAFTASGGDVAAVLAGAGTPTFAEPSFPGWNPKGDVHSVNSIRRFVRASLEDTARWAAHNTSVRYATGRVDGHGVTLYSLAQCTPDMAGGDCWDCLEALVDMTMEEFVGRQGGWRMSVRCGFRYETYSFYGGAAMLLNGWPDVAVATSAATDQSYSGGKYSLPYNVCEVKYTGRYTINP
ncbi:hypothetical protein E2562_017379 [Oryza meyeriana var. granulata]|uniref:Gnk2-homologous domain-containing protein n=1 Tax=Oryza meyeriana var. granulata TaxID=110450 RepID=A0A6G1D5L4_9ORYZ|nr:hypothetical protein E2562_017379 [Oryza meyeriana var. granulata]